MVVVEVKLLQGKVLNVNVPSMESTVRDVADKVKELMGIAYTNEGDIEQEVKLVFNGKSLTVPSSSLQTIGYDPSNHANSIVAIVLKRKRRTLVHGPDQSKKQSLAPETSKAESHPSSTSTINHPPDSEECCEREHQEVEDKVCQLTEMGFPEDIVRYALKLTNNSTKASLDYLCNEVSNVDSSPICLNSVESSGEGGIIGHVPVGSGQTIHHPELTTLQGGVDELKHHLGNFLNSNENKWKEDSESVGNASDNTDALNFFCHHPQFEEIRSLIQSSPSNLEPFMQELGKQSPDLLLRINNNPEAFLYLLVSERDTALGALNVEMDRKCEAEAMAMVEELVLKGNKTESAPLSVEEDKGDDGVQLSHMKEKVDYIASIVPDASIQRIREALVSCDMNEEHALNMLLDNI
eukprot:189036_1